MRFTALVCLTLLVAGSFATSTEDQEAINRLDTIYKSDFGRTILNTVQLQLAAQNGDSVDDLLELLGSIENSIRNEQNEDDGYIRNIRGGCDNDVDRLRNEITAANDRANALNDEINEKTPIRDEKIELLAQKREFEEETVDRIIDLDEEKAEHDADWAAEQQEHDRATYVIERAKEVIENGFSGSFLQKNFKPQSLAQVSEHFKNNSKNFKRSSWNQIFKMLASISSASKIQADAGAVQKIIDLIDALLEKIAESREIQRREYEAWVAEYLDQRESQVNFLNATRVAIENLENEISALTKRIDNATAERDEQRERSRQKGIELTERIKWCDDEGEAYAERRADRTEKLNIVSDTIQLVSKNVRVLKDFVAQRLG